MKNNAILLPAAAAAAILSGCAMTEAERASARDAAVDIATNVAAAVRASIESQAVEIPRGETHPINQNDATAGETGAQGGPDSSPASAQPAGQGAEGEPLDFGALRWSWGGFDGSKAAIADGARIGSLRVSASGLSYRWEKGGCERLGASSRTDASCLACLFCFDGSAWRGGKFDWISTSRTTRALANIEGGYNGWDAAAFRSAKAYAFVIASKDGRRRTNVVTQGGF